ncbi:MAG: tRNA (guanosine(37)-N1)-methyltransferase TrmD [Chloroflexi bacterium]|nr:tRNA (guanosine(37)-N1)-methyltransferase TrmD [Chloroflexota bacterium]MYC47638.1 tRNA (guanosine(37)-N1)-methyltransferase TrmD [Chloroflexota bacterium]
MEIAFITIFPEMFPGPLEFGVIGRALSRGDARVEVIDLRDFAEGRQRQIDDYPFGGGGGMVMTAPPAAAAIQHARGDGGHVIFMTPQGPRLTHADCQRLAGRARLVILCGRYEGLDERVRRSMVDEEFSVGDFVVTGGEVPGMLLAEAVLRLRPGVVGNESGVRTDSFATGLLEHPQFSRPREFSGLGVPEVLLSGDHAAIAAWKRCESLRRTLLRRPELLAEASLTPGERSWLASQHPLEWRRAGLPEPE